MNVLGLFTTSISGRLNALTDGYLSCSYQEITEVFERLQEHFAEQEIGFKDCLALEYVNSVPSALVLLYLLEKSYSFLLLPKAINTSPKIGKMHPYRDSADIGLQLKTSLPGIQSISNAPSSFFVYWKMRTGLTIVRG
jgi:hypothetical protein